VFGLAVGLPGLRGPARLLLWWSAAVSVLGGLALSGWPLDASRSPIRSWWTATAVIAATLALYAYRHPADRRVAIGAALALALAASIGLGWRAPRRVGWLLVAALGADLIAFRLSLPSVGVPPESLARARSTLLPVANALATLPGAELDRTLYLPITMERNHAMGAGVRSVQGYNPLVLRTLAELLGMPIGLDTGGLGLDSNLAAPWNHALDLLRVRLVTLPTTGRDADWLAGEPTGRFERLALDESDGLAHYRNRRAAPVAWLVPRVRQVPPGHAIPMLRDDRGSGGIDPAREALVEEPSFAGPGDTDCWLRASPHASEVPVLVYEDDRLVLATHAPCAAVLVTSELAYPGWRATLDGRHAALGIVNGAFRGVLIPSGDHRIELRYAPTLPWIARSAALLTLVLLLGAASWMPADTARAAR
jgi:hypothetical protein